MQFNLILPETGYSSYICLIIQQLIGTFHNGWYGEEEKWVQLTSHTPTPWAEHDSHTLNSENA